MRLTLTLSMLWLCLPGCGPDTDPVTEDRLAQGLVIILPGIEGESPFNHDIRSGLEDANVPGAMMIYHWGRPIPLAGPLINQMDVLGNRVEGRRIASSSWTTRTATRASPSTLSDTAGAAAWPCSPPSPCPRNEGSTGWS